MRPSLAKTEKEVLNLNTNNIDFTLQKLKKSKFRNSFHLKEKDISYCKKNGYLKIKSHATDFINKRLAPCDIINDGKQTPMKGHPVFIAQHATGTCCRSCLYKWHAIQKDRNLTNNEINYIVNLIMAWITIEVNK